MQSSNQEVDDWMKGKVGGGTGRRTAALMGLNESARIRERT